MTRWIRPWGLGVFVIIILLWIFCIDWILKYSIETYGSENNGALVEVQSVTFNLWPTQFNLQGLAVANPNKPFSNRFEAASITAAIDGIRLLGRKLSIEEASVQGLQFNTERTSSGALNKINNKETLDSAQKQTDISLPGFDLPNVNELIKNEETRLQNEITQSQNRIQAIQQSWEKNIDNLPNEESINDYQKRWDKLNNASWLQKIAGIKELKDDIDEDLDSINSLNEQLDQDMKKVQKEIRFAQEFPSRESKRIMSSVGLGNKNIEWTKSLLQGPIKEAFNLALQTLDNFDAPSEKDNVQENNFRGEGEWIIFPEENPYPQFLIKKLSIEGSTKISLSTLAFNGAATNIAYPPQQWSEAAQLIINGSDNAEAVMEVTATFDHRTEQYSDTGKFSLVNFPINQLNIVDTNNKIDITKANSNLAGSFSFKPDNLQINCDTQLDNVELSMINKNGDSQLLLDILNSIDDIDLNVSVTGTLINPVVDLNSNLDKLAGKVLKQQASKQTKNIQNRLTSELQQNFSSELSSISKQSDYFDQLSSLISSRQEEFKQLGVKL